MKSRHRAGIAASLIAAPLLALGMLQSGWTQQPAAAGTFIYHVRPRDTLIGIARRLLLEPGRWRALQTRNHIGNPRRMPPGTLIRIPYGWLRLKPETATITDLAGSVRVDSRDGSIGQTLGEKSLIQTGADGSVTLKLPDGSVLTLQKSGTLSLDELRAVEGMSEAHDTRFSLQTGRLRTIVKPHGDVGRFEITTPVAISAVRGTQFRVAFDQAHDEGGDETLDGTVAVTGARGAVLVPADFGTRIRNDEAPLPPVRLLPPPDLAGIASINETDVLHLHWPAVADAVGYRVQLAPDPQFQALLLDGTSPTAQFDAPAPADGHYWLRIRSIDRFGLEGRDATRPFVEHRLPAAPATITPRADTRVIGDQATFTWNPVPSAVRYRLQIAQDPGFANPLFQRDAGTAQATITGLSPGSYYWRVAAFNADGEGGAWSAAQNYTQRPTAPSPEAPAIARRTVTLRWNPQDGMRYRLQVARGGRFDRPLVDQTVDVPLFTMRRPYPGSYAARIQTIAPDGTVIPFGPIRQFEVPVPRWIRIVLPLAVLIPLL